MIKKTKALKTKQDQSFEDFINKALEQRMPKSMRACQSFSRQFESIVKGAQDFNRPQ